MSFWCHLFDQTFNPISTREADYAHHSTTSPFGFSNLATALLSSWYSITTFFKLNGRKSNLLQRKNCNTFKSAGKIGFGEVVGTFVMDHWSEKMDSYSNYDPFNHCTTIFFIGSVYFLYQYIAIVKIYDLIFRVCTYKIVLSIFQIKG